MSVSIDAWPQLLYCMGKAQENNASYLALVHKTFQGDIQLSGPLTLMTHHQEQTQDFHMVLYFLTHIGDKFDFDADWNLRSTRGL